MRWAAFLMLALQRERLGARHDKVEASNGDGEVGTGHQDGRAEANGSEVAEAAQSAAEAEALGDAEAETAEAALGDLSFAAAAFDWQAVGVRDDGTPADAHLPLAIVVARGVTAFAALVLMFAAAG